ncbi:MAG: hypothetical protein NTU89_01030 [Candidatus Dependentiae bacterium]|nr:hypothetical protein [Candidatus Dependentiae bacterium]
MQTINKTVLKNTNAGISFIEVLVVLLLISLFASFVIPSFFRNQKGAVQKQFFSDFSHVIADTVHQAISSKKIHQVFFDFNKHEIKVKIHHITTDETDKHKQFKQIPFGEFESQMKIPEQLTIQNFFINGTDEIVQNSTTHDAWFYIMPDGTSQAININILDQQEEANNKFSISINPFYSQVKLHDAYAKA